MKLKELFGIVGIPMDHTAGPQGLKKVTKNYMGKVRTYYAPKSKKFNEFEYPTAKGNNVIWWTNPGYQGVDLDVDYWKNKPSVEASVDKLISNEPGKEKRGKAQNTINYFADQFSKDIDPTKQNPILVTADKGKYVVLDGNHRFFGAKKAGVSKVNVVVIPSQNITKRNDVPPQDSQKQHQYKQDNK